LTDIKMMLLFAPSAAPRCCCAASISPSCDPPYQLVAVDTRLRVCRLAVFAVAVLTIAVDTCSPVCHLAVIAVAVVCSTTVPRATGFVLLEKRWRQHLAYFYVGYRPRTTDDHC
jgi:hypothetical protein